MRFTPVLALAGLTVVLILTAGVGFTADPPAKADPNKMTEMYMHCADACNACQRECDFCATHCALMVADGKKEHVQTLQTCRDCADFCSAAGRITARPGPFADLICNACAEACARCGKACEQHAAHDPTMKRCAEECRKCEQACRDMVKQIGAAAPAREK